MKNLTLDLETLAVESVTLNDEVESLQIEDSVTQNIPDCTGCC